MHPTSATLGVSALTGVKNVREATIESTYIFRLADVYATLTTFPQSGEVSTLIDQFL